MKYGENDKESIQAITTVSSRMCSSSDADLYKKTFLRTIAEKFMFVFFPLCSCMLFTFNLLAKITSAYDLGRCFCFPLSYPHFLSLYVFPFLSLCPCASRNVIIANANTLRSAACWEPPPIIVMIGGRNLPPACSTKKDRRTEHPELAQVLILRWQPFWRHQIRELGESRK